MFHTLDKAYLYLMVSLCIFGYRFDWPELYSLAAGLSLGAAIVYFKEAFYDL